MSRPAVGLDAIANWTRRTPVLNDKIGLVNGSAVVTASVGTPFTGAQVGDILWTAGAANVLNRRHHRITVVTSNVQVTVEFACQGANESLSVSTVNPRLAEFVVMKSHGSADTGATFRAEYGRLCSEQASGAFAVGKFTNGDTGYRLMEG